MEAASTARSCHRCSQKKIRCSKSQPCNSCSKSGSQCIFPGPGRAPRRKKRPLKAELLLHLNSLEQEVQALTRQLEAVDEARNPARVPVAAENAPDRGHEQGTLLVDEGSTRYVSHELLVNLGTQECDGPNDKVEGLKDLLESAEDTSNDFTSGPKIPNWSDEPTDYNSYFLFRYSSLTVSLAQFYPSVAHRQLLWKVFDNNVAPVTMIFHRPMIHETMTSRTADGGDNDPTRDAVAFAAYFAAATSLDPDECVETFSQDYSSLQQHYRFATQQALARANFLESQNLAILQATTLFLTCLRHPKDASFVLSMAAVVQRTAQKLGLHRDGSKFDLDPFQVEIRRRLWWSIYLLDSRSSEFHAMRPQIAEESYDTRLPLNINDLDISPEMPEAPGERTGFTDMTFCLVRCEMTVLYRRFHHSNQSSNTDERNSQVLERQLHELGRIHTQLQQRYLQYCDVSLPLQWVTATVIRLALARSWLLAHIPETPITEQTPQLGIFVAEDPVRHELFVAAIEVVEFAYLLETDPRTKQWSWLFEGYPQWHSLVFVLTELCFRSRTPALVDWAWGVATQAVKRWINADLHNGGSGITPKIVFQLMRRAASVLGRLWEEPGRTRHEPSLGGSVTSDDQTLYSS